MPVLIKVTFGGILVAGLVVALNLPTKNISASLPPATPVDPPILLDAGSIKLLFGNLIQAEPITIRIGLANGPR